MEGQMAIELGTWAQWGGVILSTTVAVASGVIWLLSARRKELDKITTEQKQVNDLLHKRISSERDKNSLQDERLAAVEAVIEHLPTREMVADLSTMMARIEGEVKVAAAKDESMRDHIKGIGAAVDQLVDNEFRKHHPGGGMKA